MQIQDLSTLHRAILSHIVAHGYAPNVDELGVMLGLSRDVVIAQLHELADYHGVVLHPHAPEVWVIHPFSLAPTSFVVRSARGEWWGNCAWCSLGVAALLDEDASITTALGADGPQVTIHIVDGAVVERDYYVHFPIPMVNAWDNVVYTCSTMLLFENPGRIEAWCARHRIPRGDVQPIATIWEFARVWYGRHLDPDWRKWTAEEAAEIFQRFGLTSPTWQLPPSQARF